MSIQHLDIKFLDTLNFLPMKLGKLPETLGIPELKKGYFPYTFCTGKNMNYVGPIPDLHYYNPDGMSSSERNEFVKWHTERRSENFVFDMQHELIGYCRSDVDILMQSVINFQHQFFALTSVDPFRNSITIASACNLALRTNFLKSETIGLIPPGGYRPNAKFSKMSIRWLRWLSENNDIRIQHALDGGEVTIDRYKVDGYHAESNTVYEFHGCLYHGCPKCFKNSDMQSPVRPDKKFGELYQATLEKSAKIRALGYNLVEFWEHEYCNLVKENRVFADFVKEVDISDPLLPRDAFFGGRTNAIKIYHKAEDDEKIKYIDICSLYPYVNSRCSYPIGHPTVITENFGDIKDYYGLIKCRILPPRGLYLPILPYRANGKLSFPLCRSCAEDSNQRERCRHSEDERAITGTWVSLEIQKAVELGYRIIGIFEIWNGERSETGLFADYIGKFLKVKTEVSGWPSPDMTRAEKDQFLSDYFEREGIRLEENNIKKAKGMQTVAKLCLNSMWGKLGQNENKTTAKYISDPGEMYSMLLDDSLETQDLLLGNEEVLRVHYRKRNEFVESSGKTSVALAAFTTAHARLILYSYMEKLGDRTLYTDTDSIIYTVKPDQWVPPTGNFLGDMTDELADKYGDGAYILEFVSAGPKNYAFRVFSPRDNKFSSECKVKGINLNFRNKQIVNFKSMVDIIVGEKYDHLYVSIPNKINRDIKKCSIFNRDERKIYRAVYTKRAFDPTNIFNTLPYGF
ncbi:uncharacterized protein LOC141905419 [Tubulanus polymorphus]|uniref:uncharacterized protein LOC141905419 n=1 Tax=Tubulanus polymorphus TaxID=672921 RepID=UPI003DA542DE